MIKRSAKALLVQTSSGECASFSSAKLRRDVAAAFRDAGCRDDWMASTIADTVEDYVRLHAESEFDIPLTGEDLVRLVLRILADTGLDDVADCYRARQHLQPEQSASANEGVGSEWDDRRVAEVLAGHFETAQTDLEQMVPAVVSSLRHLGFSRVSDSLILELARHLSPAAKPAPAQPQTAEAPGILFQPEQLLMRGGVDLTSWVREGSVDVLPVRSLLAGVRVAVNMDSFCRAGGQPLTELVFLPRLRRLMADIKTAVRRIRGDVVDAVPHAAAYPARVTVVRLDEAVESGMGTSGAAAVRLAAEARTIIERGLTSDENLPLVVKYSQGPIPETVAKEWSAPADVLLPVDN